MGFANGFDIDEFQGKHRLYVAVVERVVIDITSQTVDIGVVEILAFGNGQHFVAVFLGQKLTFVVQQLQCVPVARVVAGGDDDTTVGSCHPYGQLGSGRCRQSDVDNVIPHAHQRSANDILHHRSRYAGVASYDYLV